MWTNPLIRLSRASPFLDNGARSAAHSRERGDPVPDAAALYVYLGTFGLLLGAGLGLPIPEEIPIVMAGAAVGHASVEGPSPPPELLTLFSASSEAGFPTGLPWALALSDELTAPRASPLPSSLRWWIMLPICFVGAISGDLFLYAIGRFSGHRLLQSRWLRHLLPPEKRARTEENFHKYGVLVLVFARFLPTIRSPIFIMSGMMRVPLLRFLLADGLAGLFGVSLLFTLAFWFGDQFRDLVVRAEGRVDKLKPLLVLLAITAVGIYLVYHFLRHPVATGDPGEEVPLVGGQVAAKIETPRNASRASGMTPSENGGVPEAADTPAREAGSAGPPRKRGSG